jgi:hypothetical protein
MRDANGCITAIYEDAAEGATEKLPLSNPEVRQFLLQCDSPEGLATALRESDFGMARAAEALIDILVSKGVFPFMELPPEVQENYSMRSALRGRLAELSVSIGDDEGV